MLHLRYNSCTPSYTFFGLGEIISNHSNLTSARAIDITSRHLTKQLSISISKWKALNDIWQKEHLTFQWKKI